MPKYRAFLLGVPEYKSSTIQSLPFVRNDVRLLHGVLEQADYSVQAIDLNEMINTGLGSLKTEILQECGRPGDTDVLLLYYSGHGLHYAGKDYLVPADFRPVDLANVKDYLVPVDLVYNSESGPKTIIFFIDACREGIVFDSKSIGLSAWGTGERQKARNRNIVLVYSCVAGEFSRFVSGDNGFSLFTRALADVLSPDHPAATLNEVLVALSARLEQLTVHYEKPKQTIAASWERRQGEPDAGDLVICPRKPGGSRVSTSRWVAALEQSGLWRSLDVPDPDAQLLRTATHKVVELCVAEAAKAVEWTRDNPWRDDELPERMLACIELLVLRDPPVKLRPPEIALLAIVPFIRELVLLEATARYADARPYEFDSTGTSDPARVDLEKTYQALPAITRKATRLQTLERSDDAKAIAWWLVQQAIARQPRTWRVVPQGSISESIEKLLLASAGGDALVGATFTLDRVLELARSAGFDPEHIGRDDCAGRLLTETTAGKTYADNRRIREKMLAYISSLAGYLAIDVRVLSPVLVDHIGLADPVSPGAILSVLRGATWAPNGHARDLSAICEHPAIDAALRDHAEHCDRILKRISRLSMKDSASAELHASLPTSFTHEQVRAAVENERPAYETPHLRFELAQDEIRELLMGEQLYGNPTLAIRELYQNAVDACRYREARECYLAATRNDFRSGWKPSVIFRQFTDDSGRPYIECEDNGIGMSMREISGSFARAGKRFHDLPEFIEEQIEWLSVSPPIKLYPMSQFGIGVLSYFMLADEILIETSRLSRDGNPGKLLTIQISGSGSLFRIQENDHIGLPGTRDAGTRLRLYLNKTEYEREYRGMEPISCSQSLRDLIWIAAVSLTVEDTSGSLHWPAGELTATMPVVPTPDGGFWWVLDSRGAILSDGIKSDDYGAPMCIVNLVGEHRPRLSVNRQKKIAWDEQHIAQRATKVAMMVASVPDLTLDILTDVAGRFPEAADLIADELIRSRRVIALGISLDSRRHYGPRDYGPRQISHVEVALWKIGWVPGDTVLINKLFMSDDGLKESRFSMSDLTFLPQWLIPHRVKLWARQLAQNGARQDLLKWQESRWEMRSYDDESSRSFALPTSRFDWKSFTILDRRILVGEEHRLEAADIRDIARAAIRVGATCPEIYQRLKRFTRFGLRLQTLNGAALQHLAANDVAFLAGLPSLSLGIKDLISSTPAGVAIRDTYDKMLHYANLGVRVAGVERGVLAERVATPELQSLAKTSERQIHSHTVAALSAESQTTVAEVLKRLDILVQCGVSSPELSDEAKGRTITPTESRLIERLRSTYSSSLIFIALLRHSIEEKLSFQNVLESAKSLKEFGVPTVSVAAPMDDLIPTPEDLRLLSPNFEATYSWLLETPPSDTHLDMAAKRFNRDREELRSRADHLLRLYRGMKFERRLG